MKESDKRRGPSSQGKNGSARSDTKDRRLQEKNGGRNLKAKDKEAKVSSYKQNINIVSDLKNSADPSQVDADMVTEYADNATTVKVDEKQCSEKVNDNSSDMEIMDDSDAETTTDSVASQGDSQTADEEKAETIIRAPKTVSKTNSTDDYSHAPRSKSDKKTSNLETKASNGTRKKGAQPEKSLSKSKAKSSSDSLKNMKIHPKPLSDSSDGGDGQPLEQEKRADFPDEHSNGTHSVCSDDVDDDDAVNTEENDTQEDKAALDQKIEEMETKIKNLESELREVAALEIALYSVVPEHGSSAHKVHTPARRLSRLYIHACKYWSLDKRAAVARNTVTGLVLVSKSCGNDVSRLVIAASSMSS